MIRKCVTFAGKRKTNRGMTLAELLVATMLVAIVMMGAVTVDYSVRAAHKSSSEYALAQAKLLTVLENIRVKSASMVGSRQDNGIMTRVTSRVTQICLRNDILQSPWDTSDDPWYCVHHGTSDTLRMCQATEAQASSNLPCNYIPGRDILQLLPSGGRPQFFDVALDANGALEYVEFVFETTVSCVLDGDCLAPVDPMRNPRLSRSMRISPQGVSR